MSHHTLPGWVLFPLTVTLSIVTAPARSGADSLLSLPEPDLLERLGAPEARPRTRKGQVVYPAPGVPSVVRPGQEVVVRVRVRRALTPPPGVQQPQVLAPWSARIVGWGALSTTEARGPLAYELPVIQIRPEDEGFVYRVRLATPLWVPAGVYDLEFHGPGIRDVRPRAVRVLGARDDELDLAVVESGAALARGAEALAWLDPTAVLVPGDLRFGVRALSRWPVATFAVPSPTELAACRSATFDRDVLDALRRASGCPDGTSPAAARCLLEVLGGPGALDPCGDGLVSHLRDVGPPSFAVGFGDVALVGLDSYDHPELERADAWLELAGQRVHAGRPAAGGAAFGPTLRSWMRGLGRWTDQVVLLASHGPERWPTDDASPLARFGRDRTLVVAAGPGSRDAQVVHGPAWIRLRGVDRRDVDPTRQLLGLDPGRFLLDSVEARAPDRPVGTTVRAVEGGGIEVRLDRPPAGRLVLRVIVPMRFEGGGWDLTVRGGREGHLVGAWPASGNLCEENRALLVGEIAPGSTAPVTLRVTPGARSGRSPARLSAPRDPVIVARTASFVAELDGGAGVGTWWDLGDGTSRSGPLVRHRYRRSGPARVCALALDAHGRATRSTWSIDVHRWSSTTGAQRWVRRILPTLLVVAAVLALLLGAWKGNIVSPRHRSS